MKQLLSTKNLSFSVFASLVLSASLMLIGCGTGGRSYVASQMVETLETEILPNTSKMFVYRLRWPESEIPTHIRVDRGGGHPEREYQRGGVAIDRNTYERLLENTAYVVQQTGYCKAGFFELDRSMSRYHLWLRGECKDGATTEDQAAFGTTKTFTAEQWERVK